MDGEDALVAMKQPCTDHLYFHQSLAVAYVNEGQELRALATLERWLTLAYPSISPPTTAGHPPSTPWDASNRIIDLFLGAARAGPMARTPGQSDELAEVDPDVQVGLGVLFYSNSDYGRARDCFEAALSVRPNVSSAGFTRGPSG